MTSHNSPQSFIWPLALAAAAVVGSLATACIMPFVGLAVMAAATTSRAQALVAVLGAWLVNQIIGFGLLGYPLDFGTMAWGVALGVGGLAALAASAAWVGPKASPPRLATAFASGFVANQVLLFLFALLAGGTENFTVAIETQLLLSNAVAVGALLGLQAFVHRLAPGIAPAVHLT